MSLKSFVSKIKQINEEEGKRWVDLNNLPKKTWSKLERADLIRVYHPEIKGKEIPIYWTWTAKGREKLKESKISIKGLDPQFWITGEVMNHQGSNKFPDSKAGVKDYLTEHNLNKVYELSSDLEILPDPSLKNKWLVIDHKNKFGLLIDLMEKPTGGVPEYDDYPQILQYSKRGRFKMNPAEELKRIASELEGAVRKQAVRDLVDQRRDLQKAPKEKLLKLIQIEGLDLEAAEQCGYEGDRAEAMDWMQNNADEEKLQAIFWDWEPGTPEEGEMVLKAIGI